MRKYFLEKPDIGSILLDTIDDVINKKIEEFSREGEKRESDNIITTNILSFLNGSDTIDNCQYVYITSAGDPSTIKVYIHDEVFDSLSLVLRYKLSVDQLKRIKEAEDKILA